MRKNLDPFENHSDMEIWNALDEVSVGGGGGSIQALGFEVVGISTLQLSLFTMPLP